MAFKVEDGTGLSDSNSYVSVDEFKAYCSDIGQSLAAYSDTQIQQALVRTTRAIDALYILKFVGTKRTAIQALAWPRDDAVDVYGFDISNTTIPKYVKNCTYEGAIIELAEVNALQPTLERGGQKQEERVEGAVTVRYFNGAPSTTVYGAFTAAIRPVLKDIGIKVLRA